MKTSSLFDKEWAIFLLFVIFLFVIFLFAYFFTFYLLGFLVIYPILIVLIVLVRDIYHLIRQLVLFNTLEGDKNNEIKIAIVKMLFKVGIWVNAKNKYPPILLIIASKETPLMVASKNGHTEIVQLLLEKGADVNTKIYGTPILLWAAEKGHTKIVQLLLEKGADVNAKDKYGRTAYDLAKNDEIKNILKQYGGKSGIMW